MTANVKNPTGAKDVSELLEPQQPRMSTLDRLRKGRSQELKTMTYEQLAQLLTDEESLISVEEAGDGFFKNPDNRAAKRLLVGVPFIIVDSRDTPGKFGPMWTLRVVTHDNRRLIIIDGSTGIAEQMNSVKRSGYRGAIWCKRGLTQSIYPVVDRDTICPDCLGLRMVDPASVTPLAKEAGAEPQPGRQVCQACEGQGFELMRDADGNKVVGETFYFDLSSAA